MPQLKKKAGRKILPAFKSMELSDVVWLQASGFLPPGFLPSGFLPSGFLPSGRRPSGRPPSGRSPSGRSPWGRRPRPRRPFMASLRSSSLSSPSPSLSYFLMNSALRAAMASLRSSSSSLPSPFLSNFSRISFGIWREPPRGGPRRSPSPRSARGGFFSPLSSSARELIDPVARRPRTRENAWSVFFISSVSSRGFGRAGG